MGKYLLIGDSLRFMESMVRMAQDFKLPLIR